MRKTLTQTLLAAFYAILLAAPLEGGGVMSIYMRNAMLAGGGWKNPSVTDGLIAMWDGEWNAGPGVHDDSSAGVKDLIGSRDLSLVGTCDWSGGTANLPSAAYFVSNANPIEDFIGQIELTSACKGEIISLGSEYAFISYAGWVMCLTIGKAQYISNDYSRFALSVSYSNSTNATKAYVNNVNKLSGGGVSAHTYVQGGIGISNIGYTMDFCSLRVYSRALTAAEVAANYAVDKARFNLT